MTTNKKDIILLMGDLIIDETNFVDIKKVSPEAPVVVAELTRPSSVKTIGGVGIAARYAEKYNIPYGLITSVSYENVNLLQDMNFFPIYLKGNNVTKTRLIDSRHKYHVIRIDNDKIADTMSPSPIEILNCIEKVKKHYTIKMLCLLNYNKGFFNKDILNVIRENLNVPSFVDTGTDFEVFENCNIIRMNDIEFEEYIKGSFRYSDDTTIVVTRGKEGASYFSPYSSEAIHVPISQLDKTLGIPDTTGCGDVFDISFCSCMINNSDIQLNNCDILDECVEYGISNSSKYAYQDFETRLNKDECR